MKALYFDCFSGISGDMILGAFVDAGLDLKLLNKAIQSLGLNGVRLSAKPVQMNGIGATRVEVHTFPTKKARGLQDIKKIINKSRLSETVKKHGNVIFTELAIVEGGIHGISPNKVHFHELGASDTIVDIIGACFAIEHFGIKRVYASAIPLGSGTVKTQHGILPVPAPAVAALLKNAPVYRDDGAFEMTTPTGAAIVSYFCRVTGGGFSFPVMTQESVGFGAGGKNIVGRLNMLRVFLGTLSQSGVDALMDRVCVLETQIDDMSPELIGKLLEVLRNNDVLDVNCKNVHMKENRPGVELQVIIKAENIQKILHLMFQESTTLGIRVQENIRYMLPRMMLQMKTPFGPCSVKIASFQGSVNHVKPELRDVVKLAKQNNKSIRSVYEKIQLEAQKKYLGKTFSSG
ncbi:MAG: nickel pincer cofactor biosynthesis protein LarC [Chlamydiota bacterium]|nr:nickel pincer cofactor biosynthesis protein LarC [Chlamydiota bacterium]